MIFDPILDIFRGKAVTIPPLDGAFRPNDALEQAPLISDLPDVDNLVVQDGRVLASSGSTIHALSFDSSPSVVRRCPATVSALAVSPAGELAVALESGKLSLGGQDIALPDGVGCITALAFAADGSLWLTNGSSRHGPADWAVDLMEKNACGAVWKSDAGLQGWRKIVGGLAWPNGALPDETGAVVSESWRHRLIRIDADNGRVTPIVSSLPGYPARLSPTPDGGAWLALFAPRNRLIELVLRESYYRFDMMASVPREFWIAPAFASGRSFLEPLQCGGIRTMGIHKPWSPSRSYGLVARLGPDMTPKRSLHSRANGTRHGICSALEQDGQLFIASRGGNCVLGVAANPEGGR